MILKIAFLHFAYCCGPQADNAQKILQGMKLAAQYGASWVLTPEMAENWAHPGEKFEVWNLEGINTGVMVCADAYFAEHGEKIAEQGAELAVVVAAWPPGGHAGPPEEAWKRLSRSANGIPVLICNQTGTEGMDCSRAQSAVLCNGEVLFTYEGHEAVLIIDFDEAKKQVLSTEFETINLTDI